MADVKTATARKLTDARLNATFRDAFRWARDGQSLLARFVPAERGETPAAPRVPLGPVIQENIGRKAPARTYQDLLANAHDEALFDYYFTSQMVRVSLEGRATPLGKRGVIARMSTSPGGKHVLVETIHRPYSYLVPASRFPRRVEVCERTGESSAQDRRYPFGR